MSEADNKGAPEKPTDAAAAAPSAPTSAENAEAAALQREDLPVQPSVTAPAEDSGAPPIDIAPPDAALVKEPATVASAAMPQPPNAAKPEATPPEPPNAPAPPSADLVTPAPAAPIQAAVVPPPTPQPPLATKVEATLPEPPKPPAPPAADLAAPVPAALIQPAVVPPPTPQPPLAVKVEAPLPEPPKAPAPPAAVVATPIPATPLQPAAAPPPAPQPPIAAKAETPPSPPAAPPPPSAPAPLAQAAPAAAPTGYVAPANVAPARPAPPPWTPPPRPTAPRAEAPPLGPAGPPSTAKPDAAAAGGGIFRRRATQSAKPAEAAPPPKKRKRREGTLSVASGFLSFVLVALVAGVFGVIAAMHKLKEPGPLAADKVVYIPPRSDLLEIISQLEREGVIANSTLMQLGIVLEGKLGKLKPGEYAFKKNISVRDVIDQIASGRQIMHSVTIPEGLTSEQIVQKLKEAELLVGDIVDLPKEGALLPETYKYPRGYPRARLLGKMQEDQRKTLDAIWAKRSPDLPLRTPYELVTLASIVEKETGKNEERPRVAAVFVNRLRKGMRLQSDPTIIYGLVGGKATLGRPIMRSEIEKWTPYNTYAIDGLPPGPIANPGRAALEAAAHPAPTRDLYFVADGTGGHVFSESLDQHSRNVQNWRRLEKEKTDGAVDRATPGVPAPAAPKPDKRTQAPIGRLVTLAESHEDFPPNRAMAPDDGHTHRLGKFAFADADFFLGGYGDRTQVQAAEFAALRPARPFFTEDSVQLRAKTLFDPMLLAGRPAARPAEEERLNPDMTTIASESPDAEPNGGEIAAYPVSPAQRAEQRARAARLGLSAGSDELPGEALGGRLPQDAVAPAGATALAATGGRPLRPRAFDASEGTPLDPLRDKSWDLTSAKTVPVTSDLR
ncbi:endolytic transglycosylase MltG [Methylocystis rosea]|uniref:Endolytic murein transglycosylase n=1 Tax=Methylocystis rosea TaxID=173366 RepID=A0ABX6EHI7_9HYPH|nr:endolytic transglycosylase MltG [Methylocystis rosea]